MPSFWYQIIILLFGGSGLHGGDGCPVPPSPFWDDRDSYNECA